MVQHAALILASASAIRKTMLRNAGLKVLAIPADVDEPAVKAQTEAGPEALALHLANAKAARISALQPAAFVIGADQVLICNGQRFDKPANRHQAADQLRRLSGHTHSLITAVCVHRGGAELWSHAATPKLTMRSLSADFISAYLAQEGEAICASVGAYRLEGLGIHLFSHIEGDMFTILGLPLLALLTFLRQAGALGS